MPYKHETEHLRLSPQQDRRRKLTAAVRATRRYKQELYLKGELTQERSHTT